MIQPHLEHLAEGNKVDPVEMLQELEQEVFGLAQLLVECLDICLATGISTFTNLFYSTSSKPDNLKILNFYEN